VAGQRAATPETSVGGSSLDRAESLALRLPARALGIANGAIIAVLGLLGVGYMVFGSPLGIFNLDGEKDVPSTYSAALWFSLAVLSVLLGRVESAPGDARLWFALSALFVFNSADEFGEIHEHLEYYTGIDWQILYSPVALIAVALWLLVCRRLRRIGTGFGLFILGTVCLIGSQVVEAVEYGPGDKRISAFNELVVFEEVMEMLGAVLVGLALLTAFQALWHRSRA
jgi:hypothetical protein